MSPDTITMSINIDTRDEELLEYEKKLAKAKAYMGTRYRGLKGRKFCLCR